MQTILFIDGENFIKKIRTVFETEKKTKPKLDTYDFRGLLDKVLKDIKPQTEKPCQKEIPPLRAISFWPTFSPCLLMT